ncbi:MAG: helix-turn-helix transcriptional regulator, partial [Acholeplasmatales bacterium]|nr:helix-turn-helix transcriptional regulator [Acholeplasmatales bacterium]
MNIEIANRLQKLRKENGYSQEELADKLGISRQAVSKWERAESSPDTDNLIILARLYNMSLDELLNDNESNEEIRERTIDKEKDNKDQNVISLTDDEGQTVRIENGHIRFINKDGSEEHLDKNKVIALSIIDSIVLLFTLTGYLVWSLVFNAWEVSWVLWVLMPAVMSIFEAIFKKQITKFV